MSKWVFFFERRIEKKLRLVLELPAITFYVPLFSADLLF